MTQAKLKLDFAKLVVAYKEAVTAMNNCPSLDLSPKMWTDRTRRLREAEQAMKDFVDRLIEERKESA